MQDMFKNGFVGIRSGFRIVDFGWEEFNKIRNRFFIFLARRYIPRIITPNHLSWFRICLSVIIFLMLFQYYQWKGWIIGLFIIAIITDIFDGPIARAHNLESLKGVFLDRLGDKLLVCPLVVYSVWSYDRLLSIFLIMSELSSILIAASALRKRIPAETSRSNLFGKWKMFFQSVGIAILLVFPQEITVATKSIWFALGLGLASFIGHFQSYINSNSKDGIE